MYTFENLTAFNEQIKADNREFSVEITFNSSTVLTGTTIQSVSVDEVVNSTDALTLGCACSNKITVKLIKPPTDIDYENSSFVARVGLKVGEEFVYVPLGRFYVTSTETSNDFKNLTLTGYDGFCKMSGKYDTKVNLDTTLQALYDDLKAQLKEECNITLKEQTLPVYRATVPNLDITYQQAIGYVAGCLGGFARFDRNGELEIASYTETGYEIDRSVQYMNGFKRLTKEPLRITSIATGTQQAPITRGVGELGSHVSFENPYITDAMADIVYAGIYGLTYTPCQIKWRGNPVIQAGDMVQALDNDGNPHKVFVMSQSIKIGGGLSCTIDCKGNGTTKTVFSSNFEPVGQKLDRVYKTLEQAIIDATNSIAGNSGGYVHILDTNDDGAPDEIVISDKQILKPAEGIPDEDVAKNVWRWNKEGLGFSSNGYEGSFSTAITPEGGIVADFMTTGTMRADMVDIGDGGNIRITMKDGVIHFYEGGKSRLRLGYIDNIYKLAFYPDYPMDEAERVEPIAYFSDNSFEIQNITNGKVRFQNFGFVPRESGNLSFMKLE